VDVFVIIHVTTKSKSNKNYGQPYTRLLWMRPDSHSLASMALLF